MSSSGYLANHSLFFPPDFPKRANLPQPPAFAAQGLPEPEAAPPVFISQWQIFILWFVQLVSKTWILPHAKSLVAYTYLCKEIASLVCSDSATSPLSLHWKRKCIIYSNALFLGHHGARSALIHLFPATRPVPDHNSHSTSLSFFDLLYATISSAIPFLKQRDTTTANIQDENGFFGKAGTFQ